MNTQTHNDTLTASEIVYRIGELAKEFDVTLRTLRFYEDKGLLTPKRIGNTRLYSRRDRGRLRLILLGKRVGLPLQDIKELLDLYEPAGCNRKQLEVALQKGEDQMASLRSQRDELDKAISELADSIQSIRKALAEAA